jgi:hypothetical protein
VFVALVFAPAVACLFPDLGDLQRDGASDVVVIADASDSAIADVVDASAVDVSEAGDTGFCASLGGTHALCEDFDEEAGYAGQFTSYVSVNAAQTLDTSAFTSSPNSLVTSTPATNKLGDHTYIEHAFTTTASASITYTFDVRFDSMNSTGSCIFGGIIVDDGQPDFHVLSVYTTSTYAAVEESFVRSDGGTAYVDHTFSSPIQLGAWTRVSISIDLAKRTISATLDGTTALVPTLLDSSWTSGPPTIDLGFTYVASETQAWQARYDDVVFDFK